ncbi:MAG TPA: four helix bundle protein [Burkholderiales bacterium]|nr:four helix bundle protein [Burkholderiales bacterium]
MKTESTGERSTQRRFQRFIKAKVNGQVMSFGRSRPELLKRTRAFALSAIRAYTNLPRTTVSQIIGKQLLRSAPSVGAQYSEAQRAKSVPDFISKSEGALQELEETAYWLELMMESGVSNDPSIAALRSETDQLTAILVTIVKAAKRRKVNA